MGGVIELNGGTLQDSDSNNIDLDITPNYPSSLTLEWVQVNGGLISLP